MRINSLTEVEAFDVVPFRTEFAPDFEALNREWIEQYFEIEEADVAIFKDPFSAIVQPGGQIFFIVKGDEVVGTCAVIRHDAVVYELAKMAVSPRAQRRGYSNFLVEAAIQFAKDAGAEKLMLLSNSRLEPALRLYQKHGFQHVAVSNTHDYSRVDVQMELSLKMSDEL